MACCVSFGYPTGGTPRISSTLSAWNARTLVSAEPTPSARAASCALHTDGKIDPPEESPFAKPKRNSGYS
jgi:hypothetical protein